MRLYIYLFLLLLGQVSQAQFNPHFVPIPPSFNISSSNSVYALDVPYDNIDTTMQAFHILLPDTVGTFPLVIYIHGGGFISGSRDDALINNTSTIKYFLDRGIAYASFGYRLLPDSTSDTIGVKKCLGDSKRALQFIRYHANDLHIDPDRIVLSGNSGGAGTSLWLATHSDMADPNSTDPILQMSTRVCAAYISGCQATYDIYKWESIVFHNFDNQGTNYTLDSMETVVGFLRFSNFYGGFDSIYQVIHDPSLVQYRQDVDMLHHLSSDDPPIFIRTNSLASHPSQDLFHHVLHAKTINDYAISAGLPEVKTKINYLGINTSGGENSNQFLERHLNNCSLTTNSYNFPTAPNYNVKIFPNPVRDILYLESEWNNPTIQVYDMMGRNIFTGKGKELSVNKYPKGIYLLKVESEYPILFTKE